MPLGTHLVIAWNDHRTAMGVAAVCLGFAAVGTTGYAMGRGASTPPAVHELAAASADVRAPVTPEGPVTPSAESPAAPPAPAALEQEVTPDSPAGTPPQSGPVAPAPAQVAQAPVAQAPVAQAPAVQAPSAQAPAPPPPAVATAPAVRELVGTVSMTQAVDVGEPSQNPKSCLSISTRDMQFVLSDGAGTVLAASGDLTFVRMSDRATDTTAFIANCEYRYRLTGVPAVPLYKLTITGDFSSTRFSGIDPAAGRIISAGELSAGTLPTIRASIRIL